MQRVYLIFQRLEGVVALFLGAGTGITFGVGYLPLFGNFTVLIEAFGNKRRQHFIDAVDGRAAINMAGDLRDNLRRYRGGGRDGLRRLNLGVAHFKTLRQHAFKIDQHAVEHREEWRIVEIVIVDQAALVRHHYIMRQQVLTRIVFSHDTRQQIALGRNNFTVFVGVLVE